MHILEKVEQYCTHILLGKDCVQLPFHNYAHSTRLVNFAMELASTLSLPKEEEEDIIIAAGFHDTGFSESYENHEEHSKVLARRFLEELGLTGKRSDRIIGFSSITLMSS